MADLVQLSEKDRYEAVGPMLRYYLDWRAKLIAGFFAIIAALAVAFTWVDGRHRPASWVVPFVGGLLCVAFCLLDRRNRESYRNCLTAGQSLEGNAPGVFAAINLRPKGITHSKVLDLLWGIGAFVLLCASVWLYCSGGLPR